MRRRMDATDRGDRIGAGQSERQWRDSGSHGHHHGSVPGAIVVPHPAWYLLAWGVVAAASAWKFWKITRAWRQRSRFEAGDTEEFRAALERRWTRSKH